MLKRGWYAVDQKVASNYRTILQGTNEGLYFRCIMIKKFWIYLFILLLNQQQREVTQKITVGAIKSKRLVIFSC